MEIYFRNRKLQAALEDDAMRQREYGQVNAKKIHLRLAALMAAESLADFWPPKRLPERCHELIGEQAGLFSMDVKQPYRLLFAPLNMDGKEFSDERERWAAITSIEIVSIEDTHG